MDWNMTSMPGSPLAEALDAVEQLVVGVRAEQWQGPTPCSEWTVRQLVNHLVVGSRLFAKIIEGEQQGPSSAGPPDGDTQGDALGDDPAAAFHQAALLVSAAFARPGALDQVVTVPFGTVPAAVALHLRVTEVLIHGWDLARATGQPIRFRDETVAAELAFTQRALPAVPADRSPFRPPQPVPDDAPLLDQLAALLGREPSTSEPP